MELKESRIPLTIVIGNPSSTDMSVIQYLESGIHGLESRIQDCLGLLGSLSSDVFERRTSTGNGLFALLSRDFEQIFGQMVSIRIKTLGNTNTVA